MRSVVQSSKNDEGLRRAGGESRGGRRSRAGMLRREWGSPHLLQAKMNIKGIRSRFHPAPRRASPSISLPARVSPPSRSQLSSSAPQAPPGYSLALTQPPIPSRNPVPGTARRGTSRLSPPSVCPAGPYLSLLRFSTPASLPPFRLARPFSPHSCPLLPGCLSVRVPSPSPFPSLSVPSSSSLPAPPLSSISRFGRA